MGEKRGQPFQLSSDALLQDESRASQITLVAYVCHLLVPLILLLDELIAWGRGDVSVGSWDSDTIVVLASTAWLVIGLAALFLSSNRTRLLRRMSAPLTGVYTVYFCVLLLELIARAALPVENPAPALRPPGTKLVYKANPALTPGIQGRKSFTVNEIGLRGPSFPRTSEIYKIVTIGGSTTECGMLDDSEEWPHLVMEGINQREKKQAIWVNNAGVSGENTVDHLVLLESLPILKKMDLLIFLIGVNDLGPTVASGGAPTQSRLERSSERLRDYLIAGAQPLYRFPVYKHLKLFRLSKRAAVGLAWKLSPDGQQVEWTVDLASLRRRRAEAKSLPIPDLQIGLREYRERVARIARECKVLYVRCLFLTQPSIWRNDLSPAENQLLWSGYMGRWQKPDGYASAAGLATGMDSYNHALLAVCQQKGLECYDLASVVPKSTASFYDDVHLNEEGARVVATHLVDYLLSKPPSAQTSESAQKNWP